MTAIIYKDGEEINRIVADEDFAKSYCEDNGYTYEMEPESVPEDVPTKLDRVEAQAAYTAMMTNTLLQ